MKSKFLIRHLAVALLIFSFGCQPQDHSEEKSIKMLQEFYTSYMTDFATSTNEVKSDQLKQKYCTAGLLKEIRRKFETEELDYDPFVKGQDASLNNVKTILVKKDAQKAGAYIVSYLDLSSNKRITIRVHVVKEGDNYKIDTLYDM